MKNSDIILASVLGSEATVLDEYCTGNYDPHIEDTLLGGTNDIAEFGGSKGAGRTVIELKRKLDTGDRFDKAFSPGQAISSLSSREKDGLIFIWEEEKAARDLYASLYEKSSRRL